MIKTEKTKKTTFLYPKLRQKMGMRGITIKSLSNHLKISENTLRNKLSGNADFYLHEAKAIALMFGTSTDDLFVKDEN